jgi:hypothetical protein
MSESTSESVVHFESSFINATRFFGFVDASSIDVIPRDTEGTVEPALTHTPRWTAQAMGYKRSWVITGQFWCESRFWWRPNPMDYGGVWVMTGMGYDRFDCI